MEQKTKWTLHGDRAAAVCKSIEALDDQIEQVQEQAKTASQLEQRQRELMQQARQAMQSELSPAEQELADRLAEAFAELMHEQVRKDSSGLRGTVCVCTSSAMLLTRR